MKPLLRPFLYSLALGTTFLVGLSAGNAQSKKILSWDFEPLPGNQDSAHVTLLNTTVHRYPSGPIGSSSNYIFHRGAYQENAVLANPALVDTGRYKNLSGSKDFFFLVQQTNAIAMDPYFFQLPFYPLKKGSEVTFKITYEDVQKPNPACAGFLVPLKAILGNKTLVKGIAPGEQGEWTFKDTVLTTVSSLNLYLQHTDKPGCNAIGLKKVEVWGAPELKISSSTGSQIALGKDTTYLQTRTTFLGNFLWQQKEGSRWTTVGTNRKQAVVPSQEGTFQYRLLLVQPALDTLVSDTLTLKAVRFCAQHERVVFHDDFGRLDPLDPTGRTYFVTDYTQPLDPKEVKKTTTTPFRWKLEQEPPQTLFASTGPVMDGEYTIAAYLTGFTSYNGIAGAQLQWANNIGGMQTGTFQVGYDRTKTLLGGAMLLNWGPGKGAVGYTKTVLNGWCKATQVYGEVWINVFTADATGTYNGVDVNLKLTDLSDPDNYEIVNGTATRHADGGGYWVPIRAGLTLHENSTGVKLEVINNGSNSQLGNDLALDDVKVYFCDAACLLSGLDDPNTDLGKRVYPNPATDRLTLPEGVTAAEVYSSQGELVLTTDRSVLDVAAWPAGLYSIVLHSANGKTTTQKVMKQTK